MLHQSGKGNGRHAKVYHVLILIVSAAISLTLAFTGFKTFGTWPHSILYLHLVSGKLLVRSHEVLLEIVIPRVSQLYTDIAFTNVVVSLVIFYSSERGLRRDRELEALLLRVRPACRSLRRRRVYLRRKPLPAECVGQQRGRPQRWWVQLSCGGAVDKTVFIYLYYSTCRRETLGLVYVYVSGGISIFMRRSLYA